MKLADFCGMTIKSIEKHGEDRVRIVFLSGSTLILQAQGEYNCSLDCLVEVQEEVVTTVTKELEIGN